MKILLQKRIDPILQVHIQLIKVVRHLEIPLNILVVLFVKKKEKGMKQAKMTHNIGYIQLNYGHTIHVHIT